MHRGFRILDWDNTNYSDDVKDAYSKNQKRVFNDLLSYTTDEGAIDVDKVLNDWFPMIKADVFISHSHSDKDKALSLSYWLNKRLGITSFIDSCVWGNAEVLLKKIDKEQSYDINEQLYDYKKRNQTTSHVHMMLSTALNKMIDKTECLIFIETSNSIKVSDISENNTNSPWIYSELSMSEIIRKKPLIEYRPELTKSINETRLMSESKKDFLYTPPLNHLTKIKKGNLSEWSRVSQNSSESHPLDTLYRLNP